MELGKWSEWGGGCLRGHALVDKVCIVQIGWKDWRLEMSLEEKLGWKLDGKIERDADFANQVALFVEEVTEEFVNREKDETYARVMRSSFRGMARVVEAVVFSCIYDSGKALMEMLHEVDQRNVG